MKYCAYCGEEIADGPDNYCEEHRPEQHITLPEGVEIPHFVPPIQINMNILDALPVEDESLNLEQAKPKPPLGHRIWSAVRWVSLILVGMPLLFAGENLSRRLAAWAFSGMQTDSLLLSLYLRDMPAIGLTIGAIVLLGSIMPMLAVGIAPKKEVGILILAILYFPLQLFSVIWQFSHGDIWSAILTIVFTAMVGYVFFSNEADFFDLRSFPGR